MKYVVRRFLLPTLFQCWSRVLQEVPYYGALCQSSQKYLLKLFGECDLLRNVRYVSEEREKLLRPTKVWIIAVSLLRFYEDILGMENGPNV